MEAAMSRYAALILAAPLLLPACSGRVGQPALITSRQLPVEVDVIASNITVRRCGRRPSVQALLEEALSQSGEGNAMRNAEIIHSTRWWLFGRTQCILLRGDIVNVREREKALAVPLPELEELISRKCEAEWPDHPLMQEQCLKKELDAYKKVN